MVCIVGERKLLVEFGEAIPDRQDPLQLRKLYEVTILPHLSDRYYTSSFLVVPSQTIDFNTPKVRHCAGSAGRSSVLHDLSMICWPSALCHISRLHDLVDSYPSKGQATILILS